MNFKYTVDPFAPVPIMLLNDDIGYDPETGTGINGAEFAAELMALDAMSPRSIEIWINSVGGIVVDGYSIYGTILKCKTPVDTHDIGIAASIAAVIFQAGRNRIMADYSWLMFHNPHGGDDKKLLDTMKGSIAKMVARSGKSEDEILAMMKKETYIYANEAKEYGLCDVVQASDQLNKKRLSSFTVAADFHKEANKILNKIVETKKITKTKMIKVANKLGLNPDASEDSILSAIEAVQNKAKTEADGFESQIKELQNKAASDKVELDKVIAEKKAAIDAKNKVEKEKEELNAKLETLEKEKAEAQDAMNTEKCKNMVTEFAKAGRIKDDEKTINFWTELAKADGGFDIVKDQLEALPLNKKAPVVNIDKNATKGAYTFAAAMGNIANKLEQNKQ